MPSTSAQPHDEPLTVPSRLNTALEARAVIERLTIDWLTPVLRTYPSGDGHSVLFLPGFTSTDRATQPMRSLFQRLGYRTYRWRLGRNKGPTERIAPGLIALIERVIERADGPISLVGWSLGGLYARELARAYPTQVRQVITLGSPIQMKRGDRSAASLIWDRVEHRHVSFGYLDQREPERPPLTMPATSVFTRTDGVVGWRTCLIQETGRSQNVEVWGSHSGLGFNPAALYVVADRLAQPVDDWQRFRIPMVMRTMFPLQRTRQN